MTYRIGLYNENLQIAAEEILEKKVAKIRNYNAIFNVVAGPLKLNDHTYKETYMIEIHSEEAQKEHREQLGSIATFGSHLYADYADASKKLAEEFCEEHNFEMSKEFNSWPEYQACIVKKK